MKSKRVGRPVFFIIVLLIAVFTYLAFFGIDNYHGDRHDVYIKGASDIRWGIDISGGVEAVFSPNLGKDMKVEDITDQDMASAKETIELRLISQNVTDYEIYVDDNNRQIIVRFPWAADESNFDAQTAVKELGETAQLHFYLGNDNSGEEFMSGDVVNKAASAYTQDNGWVVSLDFNAKGTSAFASATIDGDLIIGNNVKEISGFVNAENGGFINNTAGTVSITDSVFTENTASNGSALYNIANATVNR